MDRRRRSPPAYLARSWQAERFADIDPEGFVDFQAVRPSVSLDEGMTRHIEWPENAFFHGRDPGAGRDAVILLGVEPNYRWRAFTDLISGLAARPRRRPRRDARRAARGRAAHAGCAGHRRGHRSRRSWRSWVCSSPATRVRPGIVGVLHDACKRSDLRSVSLWSAVPHYVSLVPQPTCGQGAVRAARDAARGDGRDRRARRGRGRVCVTGERGGRVGRRDDRRMSKSSSAVQTRSSCSATRASCRAATRSPGS